MSRAPALSKSLPHHLVKRSNCNPQPWLLIALWIPLCRAGGAWGSIWAIAGKGDTSVRPKPILASAGRLGRAARHDADASHCHHPSLPVMVSRRQQPPLFGSSQPYSLFCRTAICPKAFPIYLCIWLDLLIQRASLFFFFFFNWIQNFVLLSQFPQKISSRAPFIWCVCISSNIMQLSKSNVQTLYSLKSWVTMLMGPWSWWGILKRQLTHWQPLVSIRPVIILHTFLGIIYLVY